MTAALLFLAGVLIGIVGGALWLVTLDRPETRDVGEWLAGLRGDDS